MVNQLSALQVKNIKAQASTKRKGDGRGLYLVIQPSGAKSWIQRIAIDRTRTDIGLGGYPDVSLAQARERSHEIRAAVAAGHDPRRRERDEMPTFAEVAEMYLKANAPTWRSAKTAATARARLEQYAYPAFGNRRIDRVTQSDVLDVLLPEWAAKPATSHKLRQQVRAVFELAAAHEWIGSNPAGEAIKRALPKIPQQVAHHEALPYADVADALRAVEDCAASLPVRLCFRFLALTAVRSGEARGARWDEIDLDRRVWAIPADRMKSKRIHRVPLSDATLAVLERARPLANKTGLIFPSARKRGGMLTSFALGDLVKRRCGLAATVHGFRSSFRTWCMEITDTPWAVGEAALAHTVGNATEQAYARSDLFERRRELVQEWAEYVTGEVR